MIKGSRFRANGYEPNNPAMRDLLKRISNHDPLYGLAVVQVFAEDCGGVLGIRGSNDQAVPKGQAVIILDLGCVNGLSWTLLF
jgi:hypothetical protein